MQMKFRIQFSRINLERLVAMAEGFHTYPSRTRPLSPLAPMVLGPKGPGRVGSRQAIRTTTDNRWWFFYPQVDNWRWGSSQIYGYPQIVHSCSHFPLYRSDIHQPKCEIYQFSMNYAQSYSHIQLIYQ